MSTVQFYKDGKLHAERHRETAVPRKGDEIYLKDTGGPYIVRLVEFDYRYEPTVVMVHV